MAWADYIKASQIKEKEGKKKNSVKTKKKKNKNIDINKNTVHYTDYYMIVKVKE